MKQTQLFLVELRLEHEFASEQLTPSSMCEHFASFARDCAEELRRFPGLQAEARTVEIDKSTIDKICFNICNVLDSSEVWTRARQDPDAFRLAVRMALGVKP